MMRSLWVIACKEIKSYFTSPTFYMLGFLCALIYSLEFPIFLYQFAEWVAQALYQTEIPKQQLNIHFGLFMKHLSFLNLILLFTMPALTMRLLAEEKKNHTLDLLMSSPLGAAQIVLGKYFGALGALVLLLLISMAYPVSTLLYVKVPWVLLGLSYVGMFLAAGSYLAMNLFCSSLTSSALGAYVMGVFLNIFVWFVGVGAQVADNSATRTLFEHISFNTHINYFVQGQFRLSSVVFFLSLIGVFLFLTERVLESSRWRAS